MRSAKSADPRSHGDESRPRALLRMCAHCQTLKQTSSHAATVHSEFHFARRDPLDEEEICKFQP